MSFDLNLPRRTVTRLRCGSAFYRSILVFALLAISPAVSQAEDSEAGILRLPSVIQRNHPFEKIVSSAGQGQIVSLENGMLLSGASECDCLSYDRARECEGLFDNVSGFLGLDGSKQPQDFGINAQFGGRASVNWGIPLVRSWGLGANRNSHRCHWRRRASHPAHSGFDGAHPELYDLGTVPAQRARTDLGRGVRFPGRRLLRQVQSRPVAAERRLSSDRSQHAGRLVGHQRPR